MPTFRPQAIENLCTKHGHTCIYLAALVKTENRYQHISIGRASIFVRSVSVRGRRSDVAHRNCTDAVRHSGLAIETLYSRCWRPVHLHVRNELPSLIIRVVVQGRYTRSRHLWHELFAVFVVFSDEELRKDLMSPSSKARVCISSKVVVNYRLNTASCSAKNLMRRRWLPSKMVIVSSNRCFAQDTDCTVSTTYERHQR